MKVKSIFEKYSSDEERADIIQQVYDNCWNSETLLFNAMSQIVEICHEQGANSLLKIEEIKLLSSEALEESKQIGLTNPDIYGSMNRKNSLAKEMKLARQKKLELGCWQEKF